MKNMVSGRKSDRNRKNIVFGKIPQKNSVVEFFFGHRHRKFFDGRKFFDRHLENFSSPNKIFFDRKFFQRRKKMSTDFFDNHFSLSKNKFSRRSRFSEELLVFAVVGFERVASVCCMFVCLYVCTKTLEFRALVRVRAPSPRPLYSVGN